MLIKRSLMECESLVLTQRRLLSTKTGSERRRAWAPSRAG